MLILYIRIIELEQCSKEKRIEDDSFKKKEAKLEAVISQWWLGLDWDWANINDILGTDAVAAVRAV